MRISNNINYLRTQNKYILLFFDAKIKIFYILRRANIFYNVNKKPDALVILALFLIYQILDLKISNKVLIHYQKLITTATLYITKYSYMIEIYSLHGM